MLSWLRVRTYKIGLSIVLADEIELGLDAKIGHFNLVICHKLILGEKARINSCNYINGDIDMILDKKADIFKSNRIFGERYSKHTNRPILHLGESAKIGSRHFVDMCGDTSIGSNSMLAGTESQIWTHSFYFSKEGTNVYRVDAPVSIGNNCYLGSRCVLTPGAVVPNRTTIGANVCISKPLKKEGLYVNQPLRYIEFDPDMAISHHHHLVDNVYMKKNT